MSSPPCPHTAGVTCAAPSQIRLKSSGRYLMDFYARLQPAGSWERATDVLCPTCPFSTPGPPETPVEFADPANPPRMFSTVLVSDEEAVEWDAKCAVNFPSPDPVDILAEYLSAS